MLAALPAEATVSAESIAYAIGAGLLLMLFIASYTSLSVHGRKVGAAFRALAASRGGVASVPLFSFPSAVVPIAAAEARLRGAYASQYSSGFVEVKIASPVPMKGSLRAATPGLLSSMMVFSHGELFRPNDREFNRLFAAFASDRPFADAVLDQEGRLALREAGLLQGGHLSLVVNASGLSLRKHGVFGDPERLGRLVDGAALLFRKALDFSEGRVEVAWVETVSSGGPELACPFCGAALQEAPVWCVSCGTPHHRDCWKFNGACARFGCGGAKFTKKRPTA